MHLSSYLKRTKKNKLDFISNGDDYQITSGVSYSINNIAKLFKTDIKYIEERVGERNISTGSNKKLLKLGWKPKYNIKDYILNIKNHHNLKF